MGWGVYRFLIGFDFVNIPWSPTKSIHLTPYYMTGVCNVHKWYNGFKLPIRDWSNKITIPVISTPSKNSNDLPPKPPYSMQYKIVLGTSPSAISCHTNSCARTLCKNITCSKTSGPSKSIPTYPMFFHRFTPYVPWTLLENQYCHIHGPPSFSIKPLSFSDIPPKLFPQ